MAHDDRGGSPEPVKLFTGLLTGLPDLAATLRADLEASLGPIDLVSGPIDFHFTDYYQAQMGRNLKRFFFSFEHLVDASRLASIKVGTNAIEAHYATGPWPVQRPVNLDPGYLEQSKIVLASTKNFFHRLYLGEGIYGEVTLYFKKGRYEPFEWTYPDFRTESYQCFFLQVREVYRRQRLTSRDPE